MLLTATYYDIVEANRPTNDPANPLDTYQTGDIKSKGFEFEAAMEMPGNFQLTAAYSYNDAEVTSSLYTYEVGERVNDVPQHMASAWGVKTVPLQEDMALRVGAGVRYIGNTAPTGPTTVPKTPGERKSGVSGQSGAVREE